MATLAVMVLSFGVSVAVAAPAYADAKAEICKGIGLTGGSNNCSEGAGAPTVESIVKLIINIISMIAGVVAVIMILISGFKYITSNGDSSSIKSAKDTLLYAVIGIVIVALSQTIVRFVIGKIN